MATPKMTFGHRMSQSDALLWNIESDPQLRSTVTAVTILERSPDRERFERDLLRATRIVPRLHQRIARVPWNLAPPEFVVDENFDFGYHVRWQRAPGDGSLRAVLDYAAPEAMAGFDRSRPLWSFVVLEGLEGGRAALVEKMHHSLADGVGALELAMAFCDTRPEPRPDAGVVPDPPTPERPGALDLIRAAMGFRLQRQVEMAKRAPAAAWDVGRRPAGSVLEALRTARSTARMMQPVSAPLSPIMAGRSSSVRFDTVTASLPAMKAASKRAGGRLNDAFVAAVAGGFDRYHRRHGSPVAELRMTMPINTRSPGDAMTAGNRFVPARFVFPVAIEDPIDRMETIHRLVGEQRAEPSLGMAGPVATILNNLPNQITTAMLGGMLKAIDVVTSNVPGAPIPIYVAGAKMLANFGFGPLGGAATNITLLSYIDELHLAVSTDPAAVSDPELFVDCLREGVAEIEKVAER